MNRTAPNPGAAPATDWLARLERFDVVGSTNDIVAGWLRDGAAAVCVAIADEQLAGRGRNGRTWSAPAGASLLLSVGFRPTWLEPPLVWRLGAIVSLAMADAAESTAGLPAGTVQLKWPNDLVIRGEGAVRKLAGVLGETEGLGTAQAQAVIGIGINVDWPRAAFPAELAAEMTSLSEAAGNRSVGRDVLADAFLTRLEPLASDMRAGSFPTDAWRARQLTNDLPVRLEWPDGVVETVTAVDVDPESGALLIRPLGAGADAADDGATRPVLVGEIHHLRVADGMTGGV